MVKRWPRYVEHNKLSNLKCSFRCVPRTALSRVLLVAEICQDKQAVMNVVRRICATINCVSTPYVSEIR